MQSILNISDTIIKHLIGAINVPICRILHLNTKIFA